MEPTSGPTPDLIEGGPHRIARVTAAHPSPELVAAAQRAEDVKEVVREVAKGAAQTVLAWLLELLKGALTAGKGR